MVITDSTIAEPAVVSYGKARGRRRKPGLARRFWTLVVSARHPASAAVFAIARPLAHDADAPHVRLHGHLQLRGGRDAPCAVHTGAANGEGRARGWRRVASGAGGIRRRDPGVPCAPRPVRARR